MSLAGLTEVGIGERDDGRMIVTIRQGEHTIQVTEAGVQWLIRALDAALYSLGQVQTQKQATTCYGVPENRL